jgi:hypothetical protein
MNVCLDTFANMQQLKSPPDDWMEWAKLSGWSWIGIDMANHQNITQDLYKRVMAMTKEQRKSDCEPFPTFFLKSVTMFQDTPFA